MSSTNCEGQSQRINPVIGSIGEVGEIVIDSASEEILSHTAVEEMMAAAKLLSEQNRDAIETTIL